MYVFDVQGFASCLAEMLHLIPQIKLDVVIDHMHKSTEVSQDKFETLDDGLRSAYSHFHLSPRIFVQITGSVRGQEARDFLFGRIFTCLAVARSERLVVSRCCTSCTSPSVVLSGASGWCGRVQAKAKGKDKEELQKAGLELFDVVLDIFSRKKVLKSMAGEAVVAIMRQMPPDVFVSELGT